MIESKVLAGLLTGQLYIMGLINSPLCRRCGAEQETLAHILCECEALTTLRHNCLGSFFLDPEDVISLILGEIWLNKQGSHDFSIRLWGTMSRPERPMSIRTESVRTHLLFCSIHCYTSDVGNEVGSPQNFCFT